MNFNFKEACIMRDKAKKSKEKIFNTIWKNNIKYLKKDIKEVTSYGKTETWFWLKLGRDLGEEYERRNNTLNEELIDALEDCGYKITRKEDKRNVEYISISWK